MHKITIEKLEGMYVVKVGCHYHYFHTREAMIYELDAFTNAPEEAEQRWVNARFAVLKGSSSAHDQPSDPDSSATDRPRCVPAK